MLCLNYIVISGAGTGFNQSANALALNTYFKEKRRIATGISWTATGLGPIIFPQVIAYLIPRYGVQGTVLMFGGLALNAVALSLVYQPVEWHTKKKPESLEEGQLNRTDSVYAPTETALCSYCQHSRGDRDRNLLSGQYILNSDHEHFPGYEIIDPGTPMMSKSNDGWYSMTPAKRSLYSSRVSLTSGFPSRKPSYANIGTGSAKDGRRSEKRSRTEAPVIEDVLMVDNDDIEVKSNRTSYTNLYKEGKRDKLKGMKNNELKIEEAEEDCPSLKAPQDIKGGRLQLNIDNLTIPEDIAHQLLPNEDHRKHDDVAFKTSSKVHKAAPSISNIDWAKPKSNIPSRNQSILNMQYYNAVPNRNLSTNSFHAEKEVLNSVRHQLEEFVSKDSLCTCNHVALLPKREKNVLDNQAEEIHEEMELDKEKFTLWQKIFIFFDLDLLKDLTYINLMVGLTIASFAELNYSILTPFVLAEYGLTKTETATSMSLLGAMDIAVRFFVPFIAGKIGWENKTFFLFGVLGMAMGRICKNTK